MLDFFLGPNKNTSLIAPHIFDKKFFEDLLDIDLED